MRKNKTLILLVIFVLAGLGLTYIPELRGLFGGIMVLTGFIYFVSCKGKK